ncbi:MAG: substrate-binding domain-containing protein [Lachnospiraceae bacterium]|nr:substrate-binding domain-containing protein [Lachnospiraceae bacterium]
MVGFDDINFCTIYSPTISTIHVNKRMLGKTALSILQDTIEIPDFKKVKVRISGDLKLRQSTGGSPHLPL